MGKDSLEGCTIGSGSVFSGFGSVLVTHHHDWASFVPEPSVLFLCHGGQVGIGLQDRGLLE